jgi:AcrR family transcriptional regulator
MSESRSRRRPGRPKKEQGPNRDAILDAASAIFAAHGFDVANLRQIAAAADIDVALIGHQFGSKFALWQAVVDRLTDALLQTTAALILDERPSKSVGDVLRHAMEHVIDVFCDQPAFALVVVHQAPRDSTEFDYAYERLIVPYQDLLVPLVQEALDEKVIAPVNPEFFIFMFVTAVATTIAMRFLLARRSTVAIDDAEFRQELKRTSLSCLGQATMPQ